MMIACCLVDCKSLFHDVFFKQSLFSGGSSSGAVAIVVEAEAVRFRASPAAAHVGIQQAGLEDSLPGFFFSLSFQGHKSFFFLS